MEKTIEQEVSELLQKELTTDRIKFHYIETMLHSYIRIARIQGQVMQLKKLESVNQLNK